MLSIIPNNSSRIPIWDALYYIRKMPSYQYMRRWAPCADAAHGAHQHKAYNSYNAKGTEYLFDRLYKPYQTSILCPLDKEKDY